MNPESILGQYSEPSRNVCPKPNEKPTNWKVLGRSAQVFRVVVRRSNYSCQFYNGTTMVSFNKDTQAELGDFIAEQRGYLIGADCNNFDSILLGLLCSHNNKPVNPDELFSLSTKLNKCEKPSPKEHKHRNSIPAWAVIDLLNIVPKKAKSLADLEFLEQHPIEHLRDTRILTNSDTPDIFNQIEILTAIYKLAQKYTEQIELRHFLINKYQLDKSAYGKKASQIGLDVILASAPAKTPRRYQDGKPNFQVETKIECLIDYSLFSTIDPIRDILSTLNDSSIFRQYNEMKGRVESELSTTFENNTVTLNGHHLKLGMGGIHSIKPELIKPGSDLIMELDAQSYYPTLAVNLAVIPKNFDHQFTETLNELLEDRIKYKIEEDKIKAEAIKLVTNSIYGNTSSKHSILFDLEAHARIVINGQLYLLALVAKLQEAGAQIIAANTDGVIIACNKSKHTNIMRAAEEWVACSGIPLGETVFKSLWIKDVNNYIAITKNGELKDKGEFSISNSKRTPRVCAMACYEHLVNGVDPAEFIRNHNRLLDFVWHADNSDGTGTIKLGDVEVGHALRWYASKVEQPLKINGTLREKNAVQYQPAYLGDPSIPDDIDLNTYSAITRELICYAKMANTNKQSQEEAKHLRSLGLSLMPLDNKGKVQSGALLNDPESAKETGAEINFGIITGMQSGTITLDMDKPDKIKPKLYDLLNKHKDAGVFSWHGSGSREDILSGRKRGAVTFFYNGNDARIQTHSSKDFLNKYGIEIAYGNKIQTIIGFHRTQWDRYCTAGTPSECPEEIINYLSKISGKPKQEKIQRELPNDDSLLTTLLVAANDALGADWGTIRQNNNFHCVTGVTPGKKEDLNIWVNSNREVKLRTFHANFDTSTLKEIIQKRFNELISESEAVWDQKPLEQGEEPEKLDAIDLINIQNLQEAFDRNNPVVSIEAPTGSGKSYQIANTCVNRHELNQRTLVSVQSKDAIEQITRYIKKIYSESNKCLTNLRLQPVISQTMTHNTNSEEDIDHNNSGIHKDTLIALTHHTYCSRKSHTTELYSTLKWLRKHKGTLVIIDEFDLYFEKQNHGISLDQRMVRRNNNNGKGYFYPITKCQSLRGHFNCSNCYKYSKGTVASKPSHIEWELPSKVHPVEFNSPKKSIEVIIANDFFGVDGESLVEEMNLEVIGIKQNSGYLSDRNPFPESANEQCNNENSEGSQNDQKEMESNLNDLINCSFNPTMVIPRLLDESGNIVHNPNELALNGKAPTLDNTSTKTHSFPYPPCEIRNLILYDKLPLHFIANHAAQTIALSATMTHGAKRFLKACTPNLHTAETVLEDPSHVTIDNIILIGIQSPIWLDSSISEEKEKLLSTAHIEKTIHGRTLVDAIALRCSMHKHRALIFRPTQRDAARLYEKTREKAWTFFSKGNYSHRERDNSGNSHIITYSRSTLGTGANMPEFDIVLADGCLSKPHHLYLPDVKDQEAYLEEQTIDATRTLQQNIGRILRGRGTKYILVSAVTPDQFGHIKNQVSKMCRSEIKAHLYRNQPITAIASLLDSVDMKSLIVHEEIEDVAEGAFKKKAHQMSKKQRALKKKSWPTKASILKSKIWLDTLAGCTWRDITRAFNLNRKPKGIQRQLKEFHDHIRSQLIQDSDSSDSG